MPSPVSRFSIGPDSVLAATLPSLQLHVPADDSCVVRSDLIANKSVQAGSLRVVVLSDTHNYHDSLDVPLGDILIHCGDFTQKGSSQEVHDFALWLSSLPHAHKIVIPGNHDQGTLSSALTLENSNAFFPPGVRFIETASLVEICGLRIFCAGWMQQRQILSEMPIDVDLFVTHGGPQGVFDKRIETSSSDGSRLSDNWDGAGLLQALAYSPPRVHLYGHVHEFGGWFQRGVSDDHPASEAVQAACARTVFINCAQAQDGFRPAGLDRGPTILDIAPLSPDARLNHKASAPPVPRPMVPAAGSSLVITAGPLMGRNGSVLKVLVDGDSFQYRVQIEGGSTVWLDGSQVRVVS